MSLKFPSLSLYFSRCLLVLACLVYPPFPPLPPGEKLRFAVPSSGETFLKPNLGVDDGV